MITQSPRRATGVDPAYFDPHSHGGEQLPRWHYGQVVWFDIEKGFGFLASPSDPAVFVEYQAIDVPGFKTLVPGQPVVFTAAETPRGREAIRVVPDTRAHTGLVHPRTARDSTRDGHTSRHRDRASSVPGGKSLRRS